MSPLISLFITFLLLLLNAFFVLAEFAIIKVRATRLDELAKKGQKRALLAQSAVKNLDGYLSAVQLGITMASLGLGWIGEPALATIIHPFTSIMPESISNTVSHSISFAAAFIVITSMHIVIGEQAPKLVAIRIPETISLFTAIPLHLFYRLTYGPMWLLTKSTNLFLKIIGFHSSESELAHSEEEMRMILGQSQEQGRLSLGRLMMFENLFDFGHTIVKEIMVPRSSIAFLSMDKPWQENLSVIRQKKFSRYPLCKNDLNDTDGMIHIKDLSIECLLGKCIPHIEGMKRAAHFILEEAPVEKALREFQEKHSQMALVKNYDGKITGLVTMEDILEELVGEIRDEFDSTPAALLSQVLVPEAADFGIEYANRFGVLRALLLKLHSAKPMFDREEAWRLICSRENGLSTAVGHMSAFPHARLSSLSKPLVAFGKCSEGIIFPSPDKLPVKLLFLILTPFYEPTAQLRILAQLASLVSNPTLHKKLLSSKNASGLLDVIKTFENKVTQ